MANGRGCRPTICKQCGALAADGHVISFRALCEWCAAENQVKSAKQLAAKSGPYYDRWLVRIRQGVGRLEA